ncbi:MAG TPA: nitrilase-related carbon-nitrogen hydrolase [Flexivirga sp.]|uniref:nitrilase-related carbon-nitrogen hydrolase n=1 Tax=Flexivirga sp. TaxID=1962927 RepID=UPI002B635C16|nr:nitrilase-related carbon-nitrogen hydrolase [Flexivirga sp.]HWC20689.1 nitrilase-related carbon-nitrogen hydrolase [Flexivirga sp.]
MTTVKAALFQTHWRGDKDKMLDAHEEIAHTAAQQGSQVICFQELFMGPFFAQVQDKAWYEYAEAIPDGPIVQRFSSIAKETGQVMILPIYEEVQPGVLFNAAAVIDADGKYLGKYRKTHIPQLHGFWEKFYFRPGANDGWPVFETAVGKVGVYICYDRHFPEGWRGLGLAGAEIVFNPSATSRGLSNHLWKLEQTAAAAANMYYVGALNRVGIEPLGDDDFYGTSYFADPRGAFVGDVASDQVEELVVRDLDLDAIREQRATWAFYRDRRPDTYTSITEK